MNEPKHVEGNWMVVEYLSSWGSPKLIEIRPEQSVSNRMPAIAQIVIVPPVCGGEPEETTIEMARANAFVMSAAPDMLAALEEARQCIKKQKPPDSACETLLKIDTAIAKAKGRN